jgi:acetyltransferase-like isoleucine patch superfamily enzyme
VVTKDVAPHQIVAGVPARMLRACAPDTVDSYESTDSRE